jgi:hypothetical protein
VLTSTEYQKIILDALDSGQEEGVETSWSCRNRKSPYCNWKQARWTWGENVSVGAQDVA